MASPCPPWYGRKAPPWAGREPARQPRGQGEGGLPLLAGLLLVALFLALPDLLK